MNEMSESGIDAIADIESSDVAVIGLAGKFPGADTLSEFWENLRSGRESIRFFSPAELKEAGIPEELVNQPNFVPAKSVISGIDQFDASFFGFSPREAEVLDPQQRLFLHAAWEALEDAGCDPTRFSGLIGVFAGAGMNTYLIRHVLKNPGILESLGEYQVMILNEKDTMPTRVSYKLDLRGPSISVQTSCSSGLVAAHLAINSLLNYESDMALAGAVALKLPHVGGYLYTQGGILSPDGHCRAFDAKAEGTVGGEGLGIVVLKRLTDALRDGDSIRAVIKGSAINNDGSRKVSYSAPSVQGQSEVIEYALARAGIEPQTVGFIEAHGTGTPMGDPIEVSSLIRGYGENGDAGSTCFLGSVKSNIGHLDTAAGMAGLIKAILALENEEIPPTAHFSKPNPLLKLDDTRLKVNSVAEKWRRADHPRRAAVNSLGVGGTNAHLILEESPPISPSGEARHVHLLTFSARSSSALSGTAGKFLNFLKAHRKRLADPRIFADVAYTLQTGRAEFSNRMAVVARDAEEAIDELDRILAPHEGQAASTKRSEVQAMVADPPVAFAFPGQGSQYPAMCYGLSRTEPVFAEAVERCLTHLELKHGLDLRKLIACDSEDYVCAHEKLKQTELTQPAMFICSYAMASLWRSIGVSPAAVIGHSIGEYVAACVAGVFSVEDALDLLVSRGRLIQALPPGRMVAIRESAERVRGLLPNSVTIAAINTPNTCVVAGPSSEVETLTKLFEETGIALKCLDTSHAFHTRMMEPMIDDFRKTLEAVSFGPASLPFFSTMTGDLIEPGRLSSPQYWLDQVLQPVRFADAADALIDAFPHVRFLEVGPGQTLSRAMMSIRPEVPVFTSLIEPRGREEPGSPLGDSDQCEHHFLSEAAALWVSGVGIEFAQLHRSERRLKVPLPTYAFDSARFWIDAGHAESLQRASEVPSSSLCMAEAAPAMVPNLRRNPEPARWYWSTHWEDTSSVQLPAPAADRSFIVVTDGSEPAGEIVKSLKARGSTTVPLSCSIEQALVQAILGLGLDRERTTLVYACGLGDDAGTPRVHFERLKALVCSEQAPSTIWILTRDAVAVTGQERMRPTSSLLFGLGKVVPQERPDLRIQLADLGPDQLDDNGASLTDAARLLAADLAAREPGAESMLSYRGNRRFVQRFRQLDIASQPKCLDLSGKNVLVLGGNGRFGRFLSRHLADACSARTISFDLPGTEATAAEFQPSDVRDRAAFKLALRDVFKRVPISGIVVAVGPEEEAFTIEETDESYVELHRELKSGTLQALSDVIEGLPAENRPEFVLNVSSLASILGGLGHLAYTSAVSEGDAFVQAQASAAAPATRWLTVNWETWNLGADEDVPDYGKSRTELALTPAELGQSFDMVLSRPDLGSQIIVSTANLRDRLEEWVTRRARAEAVLPQQTRPGSVHIRPQLAEPYCEPTNGTERRLVAIWEEILGIAGVGVNDSFFQLGGDSLLATRLAARVRQDFQVQIPLRALFDSPTVRGVADQLSGAGVPAAATVPASIAGKVDGGVPADEFERLLRQVEGMGVDADAALEPGFLVAGDQGASLKRSIFFFSEDDSTQQGSKYEFLKRCVEFCDTAGYHAVWVPERHFHEFGGQYPSPSLLSAAIATMTKHLKLRAGSVVLPLNHPARVAEEWAMVDQLSDGRAGISIASGWVPEDFILSSKSFVERRELMFDNLATIRKLWNGEAVDFRDADGRMVSTRTYPSPVQAEIPVWVTAAGGRDTWVRAGTTGLNVLTALLQQDVGTVADHVSAYRQARKEAGFDPNGGEVTLMLHTHVSSSVEEARKTVRGPLTAYLRKHLSMYQTMQGVAGNLPVDPSQFTEDDKDSLAEFAFERYFERNGLFGTPESCQPMLKAIRDAGVTEIGCLVDFGVDLQSTLQSLERLTSCF
jgi:phthiocerol/phenolphthiocerol synthesis type-I polyketide synthase E